MLLLKQRSFVFRKRVRTPPKMLKQLELSEFLEKQIENKAKQNHVLKQEQDYIEKIEQLKLAEEYFIFSSILIT